MREDFHRVYFLRHDAESPAPWHLAAKPLIVDTACGLYAVRPILNLLPATSLWRR